MKITVGKTIDKINTTIDIKDLKLKDTLYIKYEDTVLKAKEKSIIALDNNGIKLSTNILIHSGLNLSLNKDIRLYKEILNKTRIPVIIMELKLEKKAKYQIYNMYRIGTGKIKPILLSTIFTENNIIKIIKLNTELNYNNEFKKFFKPTILNQLSLDVKSSYNENIATLNTVISALFSRNNILNSINTLGESIEYNYIIDNYNFKFTFNLYKEKVYKLVSISVQ